ncbi:MAG: mechanosensitive ion channel domain-containing protein [Methanomassiliicoccales archaeon]
MAFSVEDVARYTAFAVALWIISKVLQFVLQKLLERRWPKNRAFWVSNVIQYAFLIIVGFIGFQYILEIDWEELLASLGLLGLAIAVFSRRILENFMSGVQINLTRSIRIDDWVEIGKHSWHKPTKVIHVGMTKTRLQDNTGTDYIIPNGELNDTQFINFTKTGYAELSIEIPMPLDTDLEKMRELVLPIIRAHPLVFPNADLKCSHKDEGMTAAVRFDPFIRILEVKDRHLVFYTRCYLMEVKDRAKVKSELTWSIWQKLQEKGMTMKWPPAQY